MYIDKSRNHYTKGCCTNHRKYHMRAHVMFTYCLGWQKLHSPRYLHCECQEIVWREVCNALPPSALSADVRRLSCPDFPEVALEVAVWKILHDQVPRLWRKKIRKCNGWQSGLENMVSRHYVMYENHRLFWKLDKGFWLKFPSDLSSFLRALWFFTNTKKYFIGFFSRCVSSSCFCKGY